VPGTELQGLHGGGGEPGLASWHVVRLRVVLLAALALVGASCSDDGGPAPSAGLAPPSTGAAGTTATTTTPSTTVPASSPPSTPVTSPPATVAPTATAPATTAPLTATDATTSFDLSALDPIVRAFVDERGLNGAGLVVVRRDEGIVYEGYWGAFDRDRRSFVASSSKMITAGVLGRLADDGLLDLDAPIAEQLGWDGNPDITPAQLVSNSSGLVGLFPDLGYGPYRCQFVPTGSLAACGESIFETPDDDADVVSPDSDFRYGGGQWQVAGAVAEAASGRSWAELIEQIYVEPCGVDSLGFNNHFVQAVGLSYPDGLDPSSLEPSDNPNMEGGAFIAPPDYGTLLLMHLRHGMCDGGQVLSPAMVDRLHTDRTLEVYPDGAAVPGYGMGWWVDRSTGRLQDGGAYGSLPWLDLEAGWGAFLVIEADSTTGFELWQQLEPDITDAMTR
jgi:CubicO group peptidase (beta-lactamase class C family)